MALFQSFILFAFLVLSYLSHHAHAQAYQDPACGAAPTTFTTTWTIKQKTIAASEIDTVTYPDPSGTLSNAVAKKTSVPMTYLAVNDQWPAPSIIVTKCTHIKLTISNQLTNTGDHQEDVSLHFHGLYMSDGNALNDGPEGLTQRYDYFCCIGVD